MYKTLIFGAFSIVILKSVYEQGAKQGRTSRSDKDYYDGYVMGKVIGKLQERYKEESE